jgi:hypothetical protein
MRGTYELDEHEAFAAMTQFLREFADRTNGGHFPTLLSDIEIEDDGVTSDPAAWDDWIRCVVAVKQRAD